MKLKLILLAALTCIFPGCIKTIPEYKFSNLLNSKSKNQTWYYMGSDEPFHYFMNPPKIFRVKRDELVLLDTNVFKLTDDKISWKLLNTPELQDIYQGFIKIEAKVISGPTCSFETYTDFSCSSSTGFEFSITKPEFLKGKTFRFEFSDDDKNFSSLKINTVCEMMIPLRCLNPDMLSCGPGAIKQFKIISP